MSYIDSTRKSYSSPYEITVCMTKEECKILLPFFQKAYKSVKSKYEKYNDIHNGGEATEREENLLMKYSEQLERLESVLSSIDEILKSRKIRNKIESQLKRTGALRHTIICGTPVVNEKLSCFFPQSFPDLPLRESECRGELFEFLLLPGGEKGVQA